MAARRRRRPLVGQDIKAVIEVVRFGINLLYFPVNVVNVEIR
jgi:hypothetical protein